MLTYKEGKQRMKNVTFIKEILRMFGTYNQAAAVLNIPKSTVYFWMRNGNIPHWRRGNVLTAANEQKVPLTEQQLAYLQSSEN